MNFKFKYISTLCFFLLLSISIYFQLKNIDNNKIGKSQNHVHLDWLKVIENWDSLGILKLRFSQFRESDQKFIINCLNDSKKYCPQTSPKFSQTPYISWPALGHLPLFFLKKIFHNISLDKLSKILLRIYYLLSAILLSKILYDYIKKKINFDKNLKYIIPLGVFLLFYYNSFLFTQYSSLYVSETIETLFFLFLFYVRYKLSYKLNNKYLLLYFFSIILLSFHNYIVYLYLFFEFLITFFFLRKSMKSYLKIIISSGISALIINIILLYIVHFDFETILKIFYRVEMVTEVDKLKNISILNIFLNYMVLSTGLKYLVVIGFVVSLLSLFYNNNLKSNSIVFILPFYFSLFIFFYAFKHYHILHDFFVIRFFILSILSVIPILTVYKYIFDKFKNDKVFILINIKNYFLLFIFFIYFYYETKSIINLY